MAWRGLELLDPSSGAVLPESALWKKGMVLSSIPFQWSGVQLEQRLIAPIEWPEFCFDSHTVCLMLHDAPLRTHQFWSGQWHSRDINPGEVYVYSAGSPMKVAWDSPAPHLSVALDPDALHQNVLQNHGRSRELKQGNYGSDHVLHHLTMALHHEAHHGGSGGTLFVQSVAAAISARLLAKYAVFPPAAATTPSGRGLGKNDLQRVSDYMQSSLCADVSLDTLAGLVALSPFHFCRLFKQSTGVSPHQYVIRERVKRAKELLACGGMTVSQVAAQVGFYNPAHLARHMKRLWGVSPSYYSPNKGGGRGGANRTNRL